MDTRYPEVDAYIDRFTPDVRERLLAIRSLIRSLVPDATEAIKYGMPTFIYYGNLIHYAAFTHHIGIYPLPNVIEVFKDALKGYRQGKGSIQFPHEAPLPLDLIERIVRFRVAENLSSHEARRAKRGGH